MWKPGESGNPAGRKPGQVQGRHKVLLAFDKMLARRGSVALVVKALEEDMRADPVKFFKTVIMPLLPRESKVELGAMTGVMEWRSLVDISVEQLRVDGSGATRAALPAASGGSVICDPVALAKPVVVESSSGK